tara:strand:- start:461 stop:1963 length:1503 start_codon:yes stop_codon:yes gene_type:complete
MRANMRNTPMTTTNPIKLITDDLNKIASLKQIAAVLSWDQETMMPTGGIGPRANQLAVLAGLIHDAWQATDLQIALADVMDLKTGRPDHDLSTFEKAFLRELYPEWKRNTQLPKELVQNLSKITSKAQHQWQTARKNNDFLTFSPYLKEIIDLIKEKIKILGFSDHPYNALIDEFEPGMTVAQIDGIFTPLKTETLRYLSDYTPNKLNPINGPFDYNHQLLYSNEIMTALGYDTNRGRLDISTHPFTIDIHPNDVRITTRINTNYLFESLSSTIHEVGHALYEQGLDPEWSSTPVGMARSMGIHESQSRFWEIFIGQSLPFWDGQLSRIHELFPSTKENTANDFFQNCNAVAPHWCRVESDVVTYNMHIILRYECEKALFSDALDVDDLPHVWNAKMKDYLGVNVESDTKGCLQDVHWSAGLFGYFPSYTLGTLIAAQLNQKLRTVFSSMDDMIRKHDFIPFKEWLNEHIHFHGSKKITTELLNDLGISYDPIAFIDSMK